MRREKEREKKARIASASRSRVEIFAENTDFEIFWRVLSRRTRENVEEREIGKRCGTLSARPIESGFVNSSTTRSYAIRVYIALEAMPVYVRLRISFFSFRDYRFESESD